jgi:hypothetical protein
VNLKFLFFYFVVNQNARVSLGGTKMEPVRRAGSQDVPGVNVRRLVWTAWVSYDYVPDAGNNSQV